MGRPPGGEGLTAALRIAAKDLAVEARTRELLDAGLLGALAIAVAAGLALAGLPPSAERVAAVLWTAGLLAALLPLARSFTGEADRGTLDLLLLLPVERGAILLGKVAANLVLTLAGLLVALAAAVLLLDAPLPGAGLAPVLLLGALATSAAGSCLAALAARARAREALLPVLLAPLLLPVLLSAVPATVHALRGDPLAAYLGELQLLAGYAAALLAAGWVVFDAIAEA